MKLKDLINTYLLGKGTIPNPIIAKYQPFVIPTLSAIISILILVLVSIPQLFQLLNSFTTLSEISNKDSQLKSKINQLETINQNLYKDNLNTALIALPAEKDIPGAVDQVLIILSNTGLHLDGMAFSNGGDGGVKTQNFAIKLDINGSKDQLTAFIDKVKIAPRVLKINSIELGSFSQSTGKVQASLNILTFFEPLPSNVSTDNPTVPLLSQEDLKLISDIKANLGTVPILQPSEQSNIKSGKADPFE